MEFYVVGRVTVCNVTCTCTWTFMSHVQCTWTFRYIVLVVLCFPSSSHLWDSFSVLFFASAGSRQLTSCLPLPAWESHVLPDKGWPLFYGSSYLQAPATWWQWLLSLWEVPDPTLWVVFPYISSEYHLTGSSDTHQDLADLWITFQRDSWMFTRGAQISLFREGLEQLKMTKY